MVGSGHNDGHRSEFDVDLRGGRAVQVGNGNRMSLYPGREVVWPVRVGAVPLTADCYQDRAAERRVREALTSDGAAVLVPAVTAVLHGMGGVGKTQVAARYARRVWPDASVEVVVWITATSRDAVVTGYAETARHLLLVGYEVEPERAAYALLEWLTATDRRWLMVLDDLTRPADLNDLWPPHDRTGQLLVTTRRQDTSVMRQDWEVVEVGVFDPDESLAYLQDRLFKTTTDEETEQLRGLAKDLGHLPLALAQAAAFIADNPLLAPADYRARLADQRRRLVEVMPDDQSLPTGHRATVAATWSLSIDLADELRPPGLARPLLEIAALLDPAGIPTSVLTGQAVCGYLAERVGRPVDAEAAGDALGCLKRLSLIVLDLSQPARAVRVHALVQRATRDAVSADNMPGLAWTAGDALTEVWPQVERDQTTAAGLRSNATTLWNTAEEHLLDRDSETGIHKLLFRTGLSLGNAGLNAQAIDHFHRLHAVLHERLGPDHPSTLTTRNNLASWRGHAGDPAGAAEATEELLADQLRVLGPDHPSTLTTRNNLASWRGHAGDPAEAAETFAELLTDRLRVLGPDHPSTLNTRNNLARWRGEAGDLAGAGEATEELLADQLRVLGPDHPSTLTTRNNLASWRGEAGDPAGAGEATEELLADQLRVLGPDHPSTLTTRNNLASWRGEAGDPAGAAEAFAELLTDRLRVLGPDHPDTLNTRSNLASWRGETGDPAEAAEAFAELLTDQLRVLGPDHPDTLTTRNNLASWRGEAGDPAGAAEAFAELLTDRLRVLGPDHPDTLNTRNNLAYWRKTAAD
ncbi:tetratricopeptide repeat protein [Actinosynnema sp. NPDC023587]|uniref:tetratricopeptide repeat protein n=1 Tax=Actinosynnema sp. NPDC023587 TaxID=3154695 RepID=UPI0033DCB1B2